MTTEIPEYVTAEGNVNVYFLPAGADLEALTVAEFAAGVDVTCYLPGAWDGFTTDQSRGEQTRMCLKETFEVLGKVKRGLADLTYTVMPQSADNDDANKVKAMLAQGVSGVIVVRRGLAAATAIAASQRYDAIRTTVGARTPNTTGADEFAPITDTSSLSAAGPLVEGAVAA